MATLVNIEADATVIYHDQRSVLHYSARAGNTKALGFVGQLLNDQDLLYIVDRADLNGRTPLHDAIRTGIVESVQMLLGLSASPYARDVNGKEAYTMHLRSRKRGKSWLPK